jgi:hypothetical protein
MCAVCLLVHGAAADKKFLVQPESRSAVSYVAALNHDGVKSKVKEN